MFIDLAWHSYKYFPYEKELAIRELKTLFNSTHIDVSGDRVRVFGARNPESVDRLVYFAKGLAGETTAPTRQSVLERVNGNGANRQSTRYSAHGLHEYKGKFNPQVAKAILNMFGARPGDVALDPFCGSGTSLVECAHLGIKAVGTDINPFAVYLANAKLQALSLRAAVIQRHAKEALAKAKRSRARLVLEGDRIEYLGRWFEDVYLQDVERLKGAIEAKGGKTAPILLVIVSNLLRDYSLQEPNDLRIRRRKSPYPVLGLYDAYERAVDWFCERLNASQQVLGVSGHKSIAMLADCRESLEGWIPPSSIDLVLTSPPYATALPYIDTQRLSLVWLDLISPSTLRKLEADLVGSREIRGQSRSSLLHALELNSDGLPKREVDLCLNLQHALGPADGFRRLAVPQLLYRYFAGMSRSFRSVRGTIKLGGKFGLIIGGNHTVLGGRRFEIDTPAHLASVATLQGWRHLESIPLQTYQRFGLHATNATGTESLVVLEAI